MIKIKQNSKVYRRTLLVMVCVAFFYFLGSLSASSPVSPLEVLKLDAIFLGGWAILFYFLEKGSYIEVKNNKLIVSREYLKSNYDLEKVKRIYCARHIFLGPSMFLKYQERESAVIKEKELLLLLNQYKQEDKKALLDFLAERYSDVLQDKNCEKIRNGEKVLTT